MSLRVHGYPLMCMGVLSCIPRYPSVFVLIPYMHVIPWCALTCLHPLYPTFNYTAKYWKKFNILTNFTRTKLELKLYDFGTAMAISVKLSRRCIPLILKI